MDTTAKRPYTACNKSSLTANTKKNSTSLLLTTAKNGSLTYDLDPIYPVSRELRFLMWKTTNLTMTNEEKKRFQLTLKIID